MAAMATALGESGDAKLYGDLAQRSAKFLDENLFNNDYYQQKVEFQDLHDKSFAQSIAKVDEKSSEMQQLLKREGPKYQYGSGCLSDGVIGAWMASFYGIDTPLTQKNVRSTLQAIFRNNFKTDLSQHANAQRPGYAMGHEPGLLLCSWPRGDKPTLPFVYSDEVWTGIEYQVASHLIHEGFVDEGLTIVKALRSRYDGPRAIHGTSMSAATGTLAPCRASRWSAHSQDFAIPPSTRHCISDRSSKCIRL